MSIQDLARQFTALCAAHDYAGSQKFWSDDVVSIEAFPGPHEITRGREAVNAKQAAWSSVMTVHGTKTEGPFIAGDQFAIRFELDATGPDGQRSTMREVALYTVKDGLITEERFLPLMAG